MRVAILLKRGGDAHGYSKFMLSVYLHTFYFNRSLSSSRSCLIRSTYGYNKKTRQNKKHISVEPLEMRFTFKTTFNDTPHFCGISSSIFIILEYLSKVNYFCNLFKPLFSNKTNIVAQYPQDYQTFLVQVFQVVFYLLLFHLHF